jgi:hypothetical protein
MKSDGTPERESVIARINRLDANTIVERDVRLRLPVYRALMNLRTAWGGLSVAETIARCILRAYDTHRAESTNQAPG